jgi:hypothetical protein
LQYNIYFFLRERERERERDRECERDIGSKGECSKGEGENTVWVARILITLAK